MKKLPVAGLAGALLTSALALLGPAAPALAAPPVVVTGIASSHPGAVLPAAGGDASDVFVAGSGRQVVFATTARLVATDTDGQRDVYLKDLVSDRVERLSTTPSGGGANQASTPMALSADGRFVVFWSWASNLVAGDTNNKTDLFLRDRTLGKTERVSVSDGEAQADLGSPAYTGGDAADVSDDGRYVAFSSYATNLVAGDANAKADVFVRDRSSGTTRRMSVDTPGTTAGNADSTFASMSADGRYVSFETSASNLVAADTNAATDVFVRDRTGQTTLRASLTDGDAQANGPSTQGRLDSTGTYLVFATAATNLLAGDTNGKVDVYLRNRSAATTSRMSAEPGHQLQHDALAPAISPEGASVAYVSRDTSLAPGGTAAGSYGQVLVRTNGATRVASTSTAGATATSGGDHPTLATSGLVVAFDSKASNLVVGGGGGFRQAYTRRTADLGPFASAQAFAARTYLDVTGSAPSTATAAAAAAIEAGSSPAHLVTTLTGRAAFSGKRAPITRLYLAYFDRTPDLGGVEHWRKKLEQGTELEAVSRSFAASSEFSATYGNTSDAAFVELVYQHVLDRSADPGGKAHWVGKLQGGTSRGTVMTNFSESSEGKRLADPEVQSVLFDIGLLGRTSDAALIADAAQRIRTSGAPEYGAAHFLQSSTYATAKG